MSKQTGEQLNSWTGIRLQKRPFTACSLVFLTQSLHGILKHSATDSHIVCGCSFFAWFLQPAFKQVKHGNHFCLFYALLF